LQKIKLAKRSEQVYFKTNNEAKRTGSIVILYLKSRKKRTCVFFNERQKTKVLPFQVLGVRVNHCAGEMSLPKFTNLLGEMLDEQRLP
jgi:hypothetical protein